ncbi:DUF3794 domain-containing protein [Aminipila butyrica]|uniref:DUF3794 domain-containing protein n=1 Tax=Aminipila butyrica TaxID=433296 RepID=A0A858BRG0_9FIRM|nr:SPOCS domain-containing protein [Aminipila butyrica]QIB68127.1 DUF3794 domain-containing protein [Aminipila butyrica]
MTYDKNIPDFALQPAREPEEPDVFDPSPYDRLLNLHNQEKSVGDLPDEAEGTEEYSFFPFNKAEEDQAENDLAGTGFPGRDFQGGSFAASETDAPAGTSGEEAVFGKPEGDSQKRRQDLKRVLESRSTGTRTLPEDVWAQLEAQLVQELMPQAKPPTDLQAIENTEADLLTAAWAPEELPDLDAESVLAEVRTEAAESEVELESEAVSAGAKLEAEAEINKEETASEPEAVIAVNEAEVEADAETVLAVDQPEAEAEPETVAVIGQPAPESEQVLETWAPATEAEEVQEESSEQSVEAWVPEERHQDSHRSRQGTQEKSAVTAPAAGANSEAALIVPTAGSLLTNELKMTDIREKPETRVYIEEDILVPDTKEDLASILSMTGKASLSDSEIRVGQLSQDSVKINGEVELHTLYIPENYTGEHHIINIQSRLPFKTEWPVAAEPLSRLAIQPTIESVDYTVINERKFRAKLTVRLTMREYANVEMQVFQGIRGEKLQLLKEKIQMTHVSERKTDVMEINETLALKDSQPKPERILKYDIDIVENHKQVTEDKAVVNATIYCNVLYLGSVSDTDGEAGEGATVTRLSPQLFQGKTEFTQFIPIANPAEGSKISFHYNSLNVHIKEPSEDDGPENAFSLDGRVETTIEIYKNLEREIVTDIYHRTRDVVCDKVELEAMSLGGSGVTEAAVREIINVPEKYGEVKRVIYIYGDIQNSRSFLEQNKNIVEGTIAITLLCLPEDESKAAFRLNKELNFRGSMEIPMGRGDTKANSEIAIKELWFDRINAKQIEVNANLFISSSVYGQDKYQVIQNVCFVEAKEDGGVKPGMVVYITKNDDTLWNIAKKYRTTMEMITEINDLSGEQTLPEGMKLLIVK